MAHLPDELSEPGWIPFDLIRNGGEQPLVEWRFIGSARLRDPWFENTVRRCRSVSGQRLRPLRTTIDALDHARPDGVLPLAGIVFHASRTGSTLIAQMLACSERLSVLSEPPIVESLIDWSYGRGEEARARLAPRLRAALGYLCRRRLEAEEVVVLKAESEHILDLPLFEDCLPGVPWIFLFREPAAILLSQQRQRGRQMVPFMIHPGRLGKCRDEIDPSRLDDYCALVLERTFAAALAHLEAGRGAAVPYRTLPEYVWREMNGRFSLDLTAEEIAAMRERSSRNAKRPDEPFGESCGPIPEPLRELAGQRLARLYERLEARCRS